jgi:hypothetical protein
MTPENASLLLGTLLRTLGRHGSQEQLLNVLRQCGMDSANLLRQGVVHPYLVVWSQAGVTVLMQHFKPESDQQNHTWGLQSITLDVEHWNGPWPRGLNTETATTADIVNLLAQDKAKAVCTPEMVCLTTDAPDGPTWTVVAMFNPASGKLQNLAMARHDDWVAAPNPTVGAKPTAEAAEPSVALLITCFSGGTVAKTGWYEGKLPPEHPDQARHSQLDTRFVYREAGQHMNELGVNPSRDEVLVVWTWIGEQQPK